MSDADSQDTSEVSGSRSQSLRSQREALIYLSGVKLSDFDHHIGEALRVDAETLGVARVSYWSFKEDRQLLVCEQLVPAETVDGNNKATLACADLPHYFAAISAGRYLAVSDASTDERMHELRSYSRELGIGAYLDVPVFVRGELVGILCHEHIGGARTWAEDEEQFAFSIGQFVALGIEAELHAKMRKSLEESEQRFRTVIEKSPIPTWVVEAETGQCLFGNEAASAACNVPRAEMIGMDARGFYESPEDAQRVFALVQAQGYVRDLAIRFVRRDGVPYWGNVSVESIVFDGKAARLVTVVDVTVQKSTEEALRKLALYDAVTQLANRTLLTDCVRREFARRERNEAAGFALCFLDLDGFKQINDTYGHEAGDLVLAEVGARLTAATRKQDLAARVGGDEFAVLLPDVKNLEQALGLGQRIVDALSRSYAVAGRELHITASLGIVLSSAAHLSAQDLLRDADAATYRAKKSGKNRVAV